MAFDALLYRLLVIGFVRNRQKWHVYG
jgi:hypothetical protein